MPRNRSLEINSAWCKGCGICVTFCPKHVLELGGDGKVFAARIEQCIYCKDCELRCPDLAIAVVSSGEQAS